jgi:dTDP-4-amino-4,6-dideoxygalactose transaminase
MHVPFNKPYLTGKELEYIGRAVENCHLSGDGPFSLKCHSWLETYIGCAKALLTHSGTAALEMAAILLDLKSGDEVIMPSFTFVSTANAFVLRGAVPIFVDIRPDTLNIDENLIESAITNRTKAIVVVHYAGIACEMESIMEIAQKHKLWVVEDAAHSIMSLYKGRTLGSIGHLAALSFHETKNLIAGESGALLINDRTFIPRAEIIREKGTNRSAFFRGQVDKYRWLDIGSSYLPSELQAAFLWAQLEQAESITRRRLAIWHRYHELMASVERDSFITRPIVPPDCTQNGHLYYFRVNEIKRRDDLLAFLKQLDIDALFHYLPLHTSNGGKTYGRAHGSMRLTEIVSESLIRLPLWINLPDMTIAYVVDKITGYFLNRTQSLVPKPSECNVAP